MVEAREQAPKLFPRDLETSRPNLYRINLWMQLSTFPDRLFFSSLLHFTKLILLEGAHRSIVLSPKAGITTCSVFSVDHPIPINDRCVEEIRDANL